MYDKQYHLKMVDIVSTVYPYSKTTSILTYSDSCNTSILSIISKMLQKHRNALRNFEERKKKVTKEKKKKKSTKSGASTATRTPNPPTLTPNQVNHTTWFWKCSGKHRDYLQALAPIGSETILLTRKAKVTPYTISRGITPCVTIEMALESLICPLATPYNIFSYLFILFPRVLYFFFTKYIKSFQR